MKNRTCARVEHSCAVCRNSEDPVKGRSNLPAYPDSVPKVSIVIIEKNEIRHIKKCLDSLLNQTYQNLEIIVVDGNSTDGTREMIFQEYSRSKEVKMVVEPGLGFAHARNVGIRSSLGEIIAFTGGNEFADPEWVEKLVKNFVSENTAGVYGCMLVPNGHGGFLREFCKFKRCKTASGIRPEKGRFGRGTNMAFRKSVIEELGLFDELLHDADDAEFAWRVGKKYKIVYEPAALIFHQDGEWRSWKAFVKYLWDPMVGQGQAVYKNGILSYSPKTTLLYVLPIAFSILLLLWLRTRELTTLLFVVILPSLGLLGFVVRDAIRFRSKSSLYGLLLYPMQLIVGSAALLAGFYRALKSQMRVQ
jgi:glycosyltransferase involved in cell wall biosynthesis